MMKKMFSVKKLVVLALVAVMALSIFPATTADAASTHTTLYRRAKSTQQKLTKAAEYYGYYTEVSLKSNSSTKVVYSLTYTNTKNQYFKLTQTTTKSGGRIKTYYINTRKKGDGKISYNGMVKSLAKYKTQNGYAMMDKSSILADDIIAEAEKLGWTISVEPKGSASKSEGSTTFTVVNKDNKGYKIKVARVAIAKSKSVKTVYSANGKTTTKATILASLKKYA